MSNRLDSAKVHDTFAITRLTDKQHETYVGTVWRDRDGLFIMYANKPVNVKYSHNADGSAIYDEVK